MAKANNLIKFEVEKSSGTAVDLTAYINSVMYDTEIFRRRRGLFGWIAWTFKIKRLMWVKG